MSDKPLITTPPVCTEGTTNAAHTLNTRVGICLRSKQKRDSVPHLFLIRVKDCSHVAIRGRLQTHQILLQSRDLRADKQEVLIILYIIYPHHFRSHTPHTHTRTYFILLTTSEQIQIKGVMEFMCVSTVANALQWLSCFIGR